MLETDVPNHGFVRVAAATPVVRVADCEHNAANILDSMGQAQNAGVSVLVFPELAITGYTCGDLFFQRTLQRGAVRALTNIVGKSSSVFDGVAIVGVPLVIDDVLFNCAVVFKQGEILGVIPKSYLPTYKEFYEWRWFAPASSAQSVSVDLVGQESPFGTHLLFEADDFPGLVIGVEICEDLWVPVPPSCYQALHGATILTNPTASNEMIGKVGYRRALVRNQSGRCVAAYVYASNGVHESTTDVVFGGHSMIAENASLLAESKRFGREGTLITADVDVAKLQTERMILNSFGDSRFYHHPELEFVKVPFSLEVPTIERLHRPILAHPFVPSGEPHLAERCEEIFHTQCAGLARRLEQIGKPDVTIGVSGGLDSTLALVVACKTFDLIGSLRTKIRAFTMPGFGTSDETYNNALDLMRGLEVSISEVDIRSLCLEQMRALRHKPFGIDIEGVTVEQFMKLLQDVPNEKRHDLVFENVQARMRTSLLMNAGFVVGTGDMSELALGWATYNADHMSMYNPNVSIPKTLVKFLVKWVAENEFDGETREVLLNIVKTKISPELLPTSGDGGIGQSTEETIGPYELHDFFLFHFLRYGAPPEKILFLATQTTFDREYTRGEIVGWLKVFLRRFFDQQFKRSCLPDGPKVGSISLSPRGDWRMPSDAQASLWLEWAEAE
ncbi:MAG: NAD(+) synthase [Gemmataceae bacterium]